MGVKLHALKKYPGVYYTESRRRMYHGKPDRTYYIRFKDKDGRDIKQKVGKLSEGVTPEYCARVLRERQAEYLDRRYKTLRERKKEELTLGDFIERHYIPWAMSNKKTWQDDEGLYRRWIKPVLGNLPMKDISPFHLEKIKKTMKDQGKAPQTIKHVLCVIRQAYNRAISWELYSGSNPVRRIKMPSVKGNRRQRFLSLEEARVLLEELKRVSRQTHDEALISLHCGLRFGEIAKLRWADIDFGNGIIHIKDPKGGEDRHVYMTPHVKEMLQERMPPEARPTDLVFPDAKGRPKRAVSKAFFKAVDRLGLNEGIEDPRDKVVFHTLRHTFASWLAIQGTPILTLKELMGHKSLAMTERYSHLMPDQKREAINGLAKAFAAASGENMATVVDVAPNRNGS